MPLKKGNSPRNIDKSFANKAGIEACNDAHGGPAIEVRQCKYLDNIVKQGHRNIEFACRGLL